MLIDEDNNGSLRFWNVDPLYDEDKEPESTDESKPDTDNADTKE